MGAEAAGICVTKLAARKSAARRDMAVSAPASTPAAAAVAKAACAWALALYLCTQCPTRHPCTGGLHTHQPFAVRHCKAYTHASGPILFIIGSIQGRTRHPACAFVEHFVTSSAIQLFKMTGRSSPRCQAARSAGPPGAGTGLRVARVGLGGRTTGTRSASPSFWSVSAASLDFADCAGGGSGAAASGGPLRAAATRHCCA